MINVHKEKPRLYRQLIIIILVVVVVEVKCTLQVLHVPFLIGSVAERLSFLTLSQCDEGSIPV